MVGNFLSPAGPTLTGYVQMGMACNLALGLAFRLVVAAAEADDRDNGFRISLLLQQLQSPQQLRQLL